MMRINFYKITLPFLLLSLIVAGLRAKQTSRHAVQDDPTAALHSQEGWKAYAENPCIRLGDHLPVATWNDPCVLKIGSRYVMYLTTSIKAPGQPPVQPFRMVSNEGTKWTLEPNTPLLAPGSNPEDFDFESVETPSVVFFAGKYHLYYTGVQKGLGGPMAIGHATSANGISWTKDPNSPILRPTGNPRDFNGFQVAEPGAVVFKGIIYLYFAAVGLRAEGNPPAKRVIALATSADGSVFDAPKKVLEQNETYPARLGFDGYSTPAAAVEGNRVHLFYDVGHFAPDAEPKWKQVALHHAVSANGETDWVQDNAPIITRRSFLWASQETRSPAPLFDGPTLKLWFAGNTAPDAFISEVRSTGHTGKFGIGMLTTERRRYARTPPK